jgi:hypothetical protein
MDDDELDLALGFDSPASSGRGAASDAGRSLQGLEAGELAAEPDSPDGTAARLAALGAAHDELVRLSEELGERSRRVALRERAVTAREATVEALQGEVLEGERSLGRRAAEDERMLEQDRELMRQRLRAAADDELAQCRDEAAAARGRLERKLAVAEASARARADASRELRRRNEALLLKAAAQADKLAAADAARAQLEHELARAQLKLANSHKKQKVQTWKLDKRQRSQDKALRELGSELGQTIRSAAAGLGAAASLGAASGLCAPQLHTLQAQGPGGRGADAGLVLRLVAALSALLVHRAPLDLALLAHSLLPGLCHALELNAATVRDEAVCAALLSLTAHCAARAAGPAPVSASEPVSPPAAPAILSTGADAGRADAGRADAGRADTGRADAWRADAGRAEAGRADAGLAERCASRLVSRLDRTAGTTLNVRALAAVAALALQPLLSHPPEPRVLAGPLAALAEHQPDQAHAHTHAHMHVLARHPEALAPLIDMLACCAQPAWRVCVSHAVAALLPLSRDAHLVQHITALPRFTQVCLAVFRAFEAADRGAAAPAPACEAAGVLAVLLEKWTHKSAARKALRGHDVVATLQQLVKLAPHMRDLPDAPDQDSLAFFTLNAKAVIAALATEGESENPEGGR